LSQCRIDRRYCDRYKTLHFYALGAAIPHLTLLLASLPSVLPHAPSSIRTDIETGTVEVTDEVMPEDDDDEGEVEYKTRGKSALNVVMRIGDGVKEPGLGRASGVQEESEEKGKKKKRKRGRGDTEGEGEEDEGRRVVIRAADQQGDLDDEDDD
jgi:hypothetical protein